MKKNKDQKQKKQPKKPQRRQDLAQAVFNPNTAASSTAVRHINAAHQASSKQVTVMTVARKKSGKKGVKREHSKLMAWAELVSNPFVGCNDVKCPINFNPAPSLLSTRVQLDNCSTTIGVSSGYCRQMVFMPGHSFLNNPTVLVGATGAATLSDLDEVAFHHPFQQVNGATTYAVGPVNSYGGAGVVRTGIPGWLHNDAATVSGGTSNNSGAATPFTWDNPLPLTADPRLFGHMRWKMIAMGVRIRNTTPVGTRGGSIVSVQPANVINLADYTLQVKFDRDPSFRVWGDGTDEVEICWIPRTRDLAYWHQSTSTSAAGVDQTTTQVVGPALLVWLNAPTSDQTYESEQWAHFEISGTNTQVFSEQTHSLNVPVAPIQQALGAHIQNSPTAHGIQNTIGAAVGAVTNAVIPRLQGVLSEVASQGMRAAVTAIKASI